MTILAYRTHLHEHVNVQNTRKTNFNRADIYLRRYIHLWRSIDSNHDRRPIGGERGL